MRKVGKNYPVTNRRWQICRAKAWKWLTKNRPDVALAIRNEVEKLHPYQERIKASRKWQDMTNA